MSSKRAIKRERDDLAERLSSLLCDLTDGLLSKTNYDVQTMVQAVEATFQKYADEDIVAARAEAIEEVKKKHRFELAQAWVACIQEAEDCGWLHDLAANDMAQRNPYRATEETP